MRTIIDCIFLISLVFGGFFIGYVVKTAETQYMIDSAQALQEKAYDLGYDVGLNSCAD